MRGSIAPGASEQFLDRQPDVPRDLTQQSGRNVAADMEGDSGHATIRVAELFVRTALPNLGEAKSLEEARDHLPGASGQAAWPRLSPSTGTNTAAYLCPQD